MATDYVDAGQAVDNSTLSPIIGSAPPVTDGVTYERILNARSEPQNWLTYYGAYDGQRYSPLDQINAANVKDLVPVWSLSTGVVEGHQSPPIVNDGVMFVTTPQAQVMAVDAKTGDMLWHYKRELPEDLTQLHPTNRGVALWGDTVLVATVDCFLVALDAKTIRSAPSCSAARA